MEGYQQKMPGTQATQNNVLISSFPKPNSRNMGAELGLSEVVQFLLNMAGIAICPLFMTIRCVYARGSGVRDRGLRLLAARACIW